MSSVNAVSGFDLVDTGSGQFAPQSSYTSNSIGVQPDDVVLTLGGSQLMIAESWDWHESVFQQPSSWAIRCGSGATSAQLIKQFPLGIGFTISVGGALQATGKLDGIRVSNTGATEIALKGRDALAPVHDSFADATQTFTDTTYTSLVWRVLLYLGLVTGTNPDPAQLAASNEANRMVKAGKKITQTAPPRTIDQIMTDADGNPQPVAQSIQIEAKAGTNWMTFLRKYLDPAGLVLWAAANGTFVLSVPNTAQSPLYQITRRGVGSSAYGNAYDVEFVNDATHRHSVATVYSRSGSRKNGIAKVKGSVVDDEFFNASPDPAATSSPALGFYNTGYKNQPIAFHEAPVQSIEQAENYARRKLAEERREGYQLWYTIAGHTLPCIGQGGVAVVSVDTCCLVSDEELGISGVFYIDSLVRSRSPDTHTRIRLVRPNDIVLTPGTSSS